MGIKEHRGWGVVVFVAWSLAACGGAAPEPEAAPVEPAPVAVSETPIADEPERVEEPVEAAPENTEPASPADVQEAFQVVLSDEALQRALNLTEPGRFPVKISGTGLPSDLKLEVGAKPVEVIAQPDDPEAVPVLVFTDFQLNSSGGSFRYRYDIEGVRGTSYVVKTGERWELKSSRLSEY